MVWLLFIIDLMGLFFYNKTGSIISIEDLPTTNIIEPKLYALFLYFLAVKSLKETVFTSKKFLNYQSIATFLM